MTATDMLSLPDQLRRCCYVSETARSRHNIDQLLRDAAQRIDHLEARNLALSRHSLIMRTALHPFAMAAQTLKGHDTDLVADGIGWRLTLASFRFARKAWATKP